MEFHSDSEGDLEDLIRSAEEIIRGYQEKTRKKEILREVAETLSTTSNRRTDLNIMDPHVECTSPVQPVQNNSPTTQNNSNTPEQNSQSNNHNDDDDVVYVSSQPGRMPSVIDLCSPVVERIGARSRRREAVYERAELEDIIPSKRQELPPPPPQQQKVSPSSNLNTSSLDEVITLKCCPVCLENPKKLNPTATVCGHIFCEKCIQTALKLTKKCPLCNKKLGPKMIHRIYF